MLRELKKDLKSLAKKIRTNRKEYKDAFRAGKSASAYHTGNLSYTYRHKHIVYCLLRGKSREQIESKVLHPANEDYIQELLDGYRNHISIVTGTLPRQKPITDLKRLYVIVDETLPRDYAVSQAGHAIAEYMIRDRKGKLFGPSPTWENEVLVILRAPHNHLKKCDALKWAPFCEPDLGGRLTAVANVQNIDSAVVKGLPLL